MNIQTTVGPSGTTTKKIYSDEDNENNDLLLTKLCSKLIQAIAQNKTPEKVGSDILCPLCSEHYSTNEWIKCHLCETW